MGKIKGWKKTEVVRSGRHKGAVTYENIISRNEIVIERNTHNPELNFWLVSIIKGNKVSPLGYRRTKEMVTDIAMKYMRSHPNG